MQQQINKQFTTNNTTTKDNDKKNLCDKKLNQCYHKQILTAKANVWQCKNIEKKLNLEMLLTALNDLFQL